MSIKCSLLGHSFGETTVEREREEQGTEVVITITEMETCSRCGETRVVSENKEVTTLETPEGGADEFEATPGEGADDTADVVDAGEATDGAESTGAGDPAASGDEVGADDGGAGGNDATDAVILDDDATDESSAQAEARGAETTIPDAEDGVAAEAEVDADEDDAVIIGDAEGDDRDPGEWPDEEDEAEADHSAGDEGDDGDDGDAPADGDVTADEPASDTEGESREPGEWPDEPSDPAERAGETAEVEILGGSDDGDTGTDPDESASEDGAGGPDLADATASGGPATGESDGASGDVASDDGAAGAWPEEEDPSAGAESMGDWPEETKRDRPTDPGAAGPSLDGEETPSITVPEGTFKCSECDFSTEADATSLRAGDFCPECRRGTLLEHADTVAEE
ncbi:hypothetical protein C475_06980 [Halosimplex carlsbadense 2-9-1]|uniref:Uncharacterized protein n=1 Tax=Halosimplex carlsbadense 2-9-1 TaxID=797114 RepID=M0D0H6_9EURY|nr:hypothetical protein [Halosimplex carlsbadense]ELZ27644.1 hypothetical protein C475_06980 [Halosimplex carlsbadense 2-9-1]